MDMVMVLMVLDVFSKIKMDKYGKDLEGYRTVFCTWNQTKNLATLRPSI